MVLLYGVTLVLAGIALATARGMTADMRRVLLVQPSLQPPGGSNGVAAWMLQALAPGHRVTVLSWEPVETGRINRFFGTHLRPSDFDTIRVPRTWTAVPDHLPVPAALIKSALLMRYTRRVSDAFDVIVGGHNETDYGRRGIQVHPLPHVSAAAAGRRSALVSPVAGAARSATTGLRTRIADFSLERLETNLTLVNSNWTGDRVRGFLGVDPITVYPPVVDPAPGGPWDEQAPRVSRGGTRGPGEGIRARHADPGPRACARSGSDADDRRHLGSAYAAVLCRAADSWRPPLGPWIDFRHDLSRDDLRALMASHRYGIHGMREEHFGMAPAEMMRARHDPLGAARRRPGRDRRRRAARCSTTPRRKPRRRSCA